MADWNSVGVVEQLAYELKLADFPRGQNRARINQLFNGWPPYSSQEEQENDIVINVNDLTSTRLGHDARAQLYSAFLKPGKYFNIRPDSGPKHKREKWAQEGSYKINQLMKRSIDYFECYRSKFALDVLHGIGPAVWPNQDCWCPEPLGIEDVLIPAKTLLTMKNLPFFALYRSWTAPELMRMTRRKELDKGWNIDLVDACVEWIDTETAKLYGDTWPEVWSPEKMQERVKGDGGVYPGDTVATVDVFDFYIYDETDEKCGWKRRMILDAWGAPDTSGKINAKKRLKRAISGDRDLSDISRHNFLYSSGDDFVVEDRRQIISFQFADLSAVAPFQYHSVRSLGFLVYSLCHLQNRLRCKFNEAVFEALMMYFKVKNLDDAQRALKLNLINKGFIDETLTPLTAEERYQVNTALVELGINSNQAILNSHASSYTQNFQQQQGRDVEKTRYQVMAEVNSMTQLISAGLTQAYAYQEFEDREILRRFMRRGARDKDVQLFQAHMKQIGVPEKYMVADCWESQHEKVLGAGNQTLEMGIAEWLMSNREKFDPDPQREILRKATFAVTGDPGFADNLVPEEQQISNSITDAQTAAASLLRGLPTTLKQGLNHQEYADTLLAIMASEVQKISSRDNVGTPEELAGLQNLAGQTVTGQPINGNGIADHIKVLESNKENKQLVAELNGKLGQLMNLVKGFSQRLQQHQQAAAKQQAGANGGMDPKDAAKIQATQATAAAKTQNMRESHALKTAQRKIQFEQQIQQDQQRNELELQRMAAETALSIQEKKMRSFDE